MPKSKSSSTKKNNLALGEIIDGHKMYIVFKNGIKIYPISEFEFKGSKDLTLIKHQRFLVRVEINGEITTFNKVLKNTELNEALLKTHLFYYKKIMNIKNK